VCRLLAYVGAPIILDQLLYQPRNSLIKQSYDAKEIEEPLNGDGFGIGWYVPELEPTPAVFVSTSPAWSNRNLRMIAPKIKSPCILAHVRAASVGDTSEANCHPFSYGPFLGMHNGGIGGFEGIKREMRRSLPDEIYNWLRGQTDSEHFFAAFLQRMAKKKDAHNSKDIVDALRDTLAYVESLQKKKGVEEFSYINFVVSDGQRVVAMRYTTDKEEEALSLYYSEGSRYVCEGDVCRMIKADPKDHSVLIVSEKLTDLRQDWKKVPPNHVVVVHSNTEITVERI
jgi:ergothioneine biosynthesis protein EgtC